MGIFRRRKRPASGARSLPVPPLTMRRLVGLEDESDFEDPSGAEVFPDLRPERVYDFGCGCGRLARLLLQQRRPVRQYVGVDLHAGMIEWCQENLAPRARGFEFLHHDVENPGFNPGPDKPRLLSLPGADASFDLVYVWSVFTHLRESQAPHYLRECARLLAPGGVIRSTWFLFDKGPFPMMQPFQNALYINENDLTNAVIFDRTWLRSLSEELGLVVASATPPNVRGFHWEIDLRRAGEAPSAEFPPDNAPLGSHPPPVVTVPPYSVR